MSKLPCVACTHALSAHTRDGKVAACRITNCACEAFVEAPLKTPPGFARRVCIDVPDGYVVSLQLIPHTEEAA